MRRLTALALLALLAAAPAQALEKPLGAVSHIHGLAVDPLDPDGLYLATHHGLWLAAPSGTARLVSNHQDDLMGFSPHPTEPSTFFASGHPAGGGNLGLIVSRDSGATWQQVSPGLDGPADFHQLDIADAAPQVLYGVWRGLQVSRDGGTSWQRVGPAPEGLIDLAVAGGAERLLAATETGLLESPDGGRSWRPADLRRNPATMVEGLADGTAYAWFHGVGLVRQRPGERGWTQLGALPGGGYLLHFAVAPGRFYGVDGQGRILVSRDEGKSWLPYGSK
ncbi:MAG TPA: exo-alpha-sialidase [Alphaproteobacteria bacterium]|nr:exo-alpha-sialidase [Alphaproteobacteria bacterium]